MIIQLPMYCDTQDDYQNYYNNENNVIFINFSIKNTTEGMRGFNPKNLNVCKNLVKAVRLFN